MMSILSTVMIPLLLPMGQQQTPREYVIREMKPPVLKDVRYKFEWRSSWMSGDFDSNGVADVMLTGQFSPDLYTSLLGEGYFEFLSEASGEPTKVILDKNNMFGVTSAADWGLLKTPTGFQALINKGGFGANAGVNSFDWESGDFLGLLVAPPSFPPPTPDAKGPRYIYPAGDQNGDGFEDFFWLGSQSIGTGYVYCGLYDGATLSVIWQYAEDNAFYISAPHFTGAGPLPDSNNDGAADLLVSISHWNLGASTHSYICFNGSDGVEIWRENADYSMNTEIGLGPDFSGDGVPDPVFLEVRLPLVQQRALDGATGNELWVTPLASLESQYPGDDVIQLSYWRGFQVNQNNLSQAEFVMYHNVIFAAGGGIIAFAHYAANDGTFLGSFPLSTSLAPWSPSSGEINNSRSPMRLGDIDRDGLEEIGIPFFDWERSPGWSVNGSNPNPSTQLAIVGMRTLFVPEVHALSSANLDFDIAVPAGINKDFVVVLSTEFDPYGGVEVGPWRLFLDQSPIMNYTMSSQMLSGTLDQNGKGSVSAAIPAHPSLFGKVLYSKALILNPVGSAERILTLSSMGITELQ